MDTFHSKPRQDFETRLSIHINHPEDFNHDIHDFEMMNHDPTSPVIPAKAGIQMGRRKGEHPAMSL